MIHYLLKERSYGTLIISSGLVGLLFSIHIFGINFLAGGGPYWETATDDVLQHLIGYHYFMNDIWRFPVFFTTNLNFPYGQNIIFTDSIPILALVSKMFRSYLPIYKNNFGIWYGMCYVLQAASMTSLLGFLGFKNYFSMFVASLFALSIPSFLFRFEHAALISHFLIIFSLLIYLNIIRSYTFHQGVFIILILTVSILVHFYIFMMVLLIIIAAFIQKYINKQMRGKALFKNFLLFACIILITMYCSGYVDVNKIPKGGTGFGNYSMNLLSPVYPYLSSLLPDFPKIDPTGGQGEGYNYLGLGLIFLLLICVVKHGRSCIEMIQKHKVLCGILIFLTIFSISNKVYIANYKLIEVGFSSLKTSDSKQNDFQNITADTTPMHNDQLTLKKIIRYPFDQLRSSGRFFWPVVYVILIASIVVTLKKFEMNTALFIILLALVIQVFDTMQLRHIMSVKALNGEMPLSYYQAWTDLISQHSSIKILPVHQCSPNRSLNLKLQLIAAKHNKPTNGVYSSRNIYGMDFNCNQTSQEIDIMKISASELYIYIGHDDKLLNKFPDANYCKYFQEGYFCSTSHYQSRSPSVSDSFARQ